MSEDDARCEHPDSPSGHEGCHDDCGHEHLGNAQGQGHDQAEKLVESALRISLKRDIRLDAPVAVELIEARLAMRLEGLAASVAVDGVVLGHIKALVQAEGGALALSVTRIGSIEPRYRGNWEGQAPICAFEVSLNVLSLIRPTSDIDTLLDLEGLFS